MPVNIYKPRKDNMGHFFQFNVGKNNNSNNNKSPYTLYVKAIKQYSWKNGQSSFQENEKVEGKNISVKFNEFEAAGMLHGLPNLFKDFPKNDIEQNEMSLFHANGDDKTRISFTGVEKGGKRGVFFSISRNGATFKIPLLIQECVVVAEYCRFYLNEIFKDGFKKSISTVKQPVKEKTVPNLFDSDTKDDMDESEKEELF